MVDAGGSDSGGRTERLVCLLARSGQREGTPVQSVEWPHPGYPRGAGHTGSSVLAHAEGQQSKPGPGLNATALTAEDAESAEKPIDPNAAGLDPVTETMIGTAM